MPVYSRAKTFNEQLLAHHLIDTAAGKEERLFYLGQLFEPLRLNIFREAMLSEFEHAVHTASAIGTPMPGTTMSDTYRKPMPRPKADGRGDPRCRNCSGHYSAVR